MSTPVPFAEVREPLEQLIGDPNLTPFRRLLERIQQVSRTQDYPAEVYRFLIEMFSRLSREIASGKRTGGELYGPDLFDNYRAYSQQNWEVETVNQAQSIFQFYLGKLGQPLMNVVRVPVVLLVMTREQADELTDGEAHTTAKQKHPDLGRMLTAIDLLDTGTPWQDNYGERPEDWRPAMSAEKKTFSTILNETLSKVEVEAQVQPRFISPQELLIEELPSANLYNNRLALRDLRHGGCLVVVDSISLYHPLIQMAFQSAKLDAFRSASVVRVAPHPELLRLEVRLAFSLDQLIDHEFQTRRAIELDKHCKAVPDQVDFVQFLKSGTERLCGTPESPNQRHWFKTGGTPA